MQHLKAFSDALDEMFPVHVGVVGHVSKNVTVVHPRRDYIRIWTIIERRAPEGQEIFAFVHCPQLPPNFDFSEEALDNRQHQYATN